MVGAISLVGAHERLVRSNGEIRIVYFFDLARVDPGIEVPCGGTVLA